MGPSLKPNKFPRKLQDTYPNGQLKIIIKNQGQIKALRNMPESRSNLGHVHPIGYCKL